MIRFHCSCGKKLKVDPSYAGHHVKCGACGARLLVPSLTAEATASAPAPEAAPPPADGLEGLAQAMRSAPRPSVIRPGTNRGTPVAKMGAGAGPASTSDRLSATRARHQAPKDNKGLLIGVGVAFAVLAAIVAVMAITGSLGTPEPVTDQKAATQTTAPIAAKKVAAPTPTAAATTPTDAAPAVPAATESAADTTPTS